jgi:thioester reductase-like protein
VHDILFTGFPGFIGARLIPRLLALREDARFTCLVQERFLGAAREGIAQIEQAVPEARGRLSLVQGDITQPGLGIAPEESKRLRARLAGAWHLAAVYDLAVARDVGQRINVEGTRNVLEFVRGAPGFKRLDYVSTAYVAGDATGVFREVDLDLGQGFKNHYEETKYLAEVEVVRSGVPATVYRPGIVVGDSRTGETAKFDGPYFILAAMERIPSPGVFPRVGSGHNTVNLVPVDYVIEGMARLSVAAAAAAAPLATYHLTDPAPLTALQIAKALAGALGKSFTYLPLPALLVKAAFMPAPVQDFFGMPVQALDYFDHACHFDSTQARRILEPLGVVCPRLDTYTERLVRFYLEKKGRVRRTAMI